ncbi:MAG TPA: TetR family transcriptional regulator [Acidimicrobiia bacterium]|nr:TetR family transcriptional regulator [Acidimicrobiia bacterium]
MARPSSKPGPGRPAGVDAAETRDRILKAARSCFAAHGYEGTSTRMIADKAGLATAALYHHFGKKSDLMLAVHRARNEASYVPLRAAVDAADTFAGKIEGLLMAIHDQLRADPEQGVFASVARDEARRHPELRELGEDKEFEDLFAEIIRFGVRAGDIAPSDAVQARGALASMAFGLSMLAPDMTPSAHALVARGCVRALTGTLLRQPDREEAR